jgi:hypothetical protein
MAKAPRVPGEPADAAVETDQDAAAPAMDPSVQQAIDAAVATAVAAERARFDAVIKAQAEAMTGPDDGRPQFSAMHSTQAKVWFDKHPEITNRNPVQCIDGWYVPAGAFAPPEQATR